VLSSTPPDAWRSQSEVERVRRKGGMPLAASHHRLPHSGGIEAGRKGGGGRDGSPVVQ